MLFGALDRSRESHADVGSNLSIYDVRANLSITFMQPSYQTAALQHTRVKLSWDEVPPARAKLTHHKSVRPPFSVLLFTALYHSLSLSALLYCSLPFPPPQCPPSFFCALPSASSVSALVSLRP